jgi:hypothetical protein
MKPLLKTSELKTANELYNMYKNKKREFVEKYGKDAEKVMRGRAIKTAKQKTKNMDKNKIKEMVKSALQTPPKIDAKEYLSNRGNTLQERFNPTDTITMDVPLFIRMMEYAREDAKSDMDLHDVAEKAIQASVDGKTLTMSDYDSVISKDVLDEDDWKQSDDESDMAHSQLISIKNNSDKLMNVIDPNEQLDAWVQSKLTKAQDYLQSVYDYLNGEETVEEKKLTQAEKEKKEDIVKAMKKTFKGPKPALYAIATKKAKEVAEGSLAEKIMSKLKGESTLNEYDEIELDDDDFLDYGGDDSYRSQMKDYYNSDNFPNEEARNKQIKAHDASVEEFVADNGNILSIDKLANWLGY